MHKDVSLESIAFRNMEKACQINSPNSLEFYLESYKKTLSLAGVGKRNVVPPTVATTYGNQVCTLLTSLEDMGNIDAVFSRLQNKVGGDGEAATKYAYLATLQNFLRFLNLRYPQVQAKKRECLVKHVKDWLQRQRKKKEKRESFVKEKSRRKLKGLPFPSTAISKYCAKHSKSMDQIRNKKPGTVKKVCLESLYGDIFVRIICRLGCRPSVLCGMRLVELRAAERIECGRYSILVKEQKEQSQHACIILDEKEINDVKNTSLLAWQFRKHDPDENDPVFPSLQEEGEMDLKNYEFSKMFEKRSELVFLKKNITATDVRKLITTGVRRQPRDVQEAVARASGHSVLIAGKHYDISHPHEIVSKAKDAMAEIAAGV